ncbi:flagellar export protein FliJ [Ghiorsea bivora]|uniref:hypothetical protein n=1 Tax=Ghiorsea bivora TaxID=1485545 RepID=UPI00057111A3|nr:hypothetical protein [Ghiorsea bivora]
MTRSPHQLLSQVSEHKRDKESDILKQLTDYHVELEAKMNDAIQMRATLEAQRVTNMEHGTQATELLMLEQATQEQRLRIYEVSCEIAALDKAIEEQRKKWAEQHKKCKAHETMAQKHAHTAQRKQEQTQQNVLDDQYSAKMFGNRTEVV